MWRPGGVPVRVACAPLRIVFLCARIGTGAGRGLVWQGQEARRAETTTRDTGCSEDWMLVCQQLPAFNWLSQGGLRLPLSHCASEDGEAPAPLPLAGSLGCGHHKPIL